MPFIYLFSVIWDFCTFYTWSLLEMHLNFLLTLKTCGYYILDGSNSWGIFRHFPSIKSWKGNKNEGEKKSGGKRNRITVTQNPWETLDFYYLSLLWKLFKVQRFIQSLNMHYLIVLKPISLDYDSQQHSLQFTEEFHTEAFRQFYSVLIQTWSKPYQTHTK